MPTKALLCGSLVSLIYLSTGTSHAELLINEVDTLTSRNPEAAEFVELYSDTPGMSLDGRSIAVLDGDTDRVTEVFPLDGLKLDQDGFFVLGNPGVPDVDLVVPDTDSPGFLPVTSGAVVLVSGEPPMIGNTAASLSPDDAIVYAVGGSVPTDNGLRLPLLAPGQSIPNESGGSNRFRHSLGRVPDGAGGARVTSDVRVGKPTPGAPNSPAAPSTSVIITGGDLSDTLRHSEDAGQISARVRIIDSNSNPQSAPGGGLPITITCSDLSELYVSIPAQAGVAAIPNTERAAALTVTIPGGRSEIAFDMNIVNDSVADGDQRIYVSVDAAGRNNNICDLTILDDDDDPAATVVINEVNAKPCEDANGDGMINDGDEFIEIVNPGGSVRDLSGMQLSANDGAPFYTFPAGSKLVGNASAVVFANGVDNGIGQNGSDFGCALTFGASSPGGFPLDDSYEVVRLWSEGVEVADFSVHPLGPGSSTRTPDLSTNVAKHAQVDGLYGSPGAKTDGSAFATNTLTIAIAPTCAAELMDMVSSPINSVDDAGAIVITVERVGPTVGPLEVSLASNIVGQAVPHDATITIPAGQTTAQTWIDVKRLPAETGPNSVTMTASNSCYTSPTAALEVRDDGLDLSFVDPLSDPAPNHSAVVAGAGLGVCELVVTRSSGATGTLKAKLYVRDSTNTAMLLPDEVTLSGTGVSGSGAEYDLTFDGTDTLTIDVNPNPASTGAMLELAAVESISDDAPADEECANGSATLEVIANSLDNGPLINEINADNPGDADDMEFVELVVPGAEAIEDLAGWSVVLFNNAGDAYEAIDLTSTDASGYLTIGDPGIRNGDASTDGWINHASFDMDDGPAAVGLYAAPASDFPTDPKATPAKATRKALFDAVVYGPEKTSAMADLLAALTPGQTTQATGPADSVKALARGTDPPSNDNLRSWDGDAIVQVPTPGLSNSAYDSAFKAWAASFGIAAEPLGDPDGDCIPNVIEYAVGGDPTKFTASATFLDQSRDGKMITVQKGAIGGCDAHLKITVERAGDLTAWDDSDPPLEIVIDDETMLKVNDTGADAKAFHRLRVELMPPKKMPPS